MVQFMNIRQNNLSYKQTGLMAICLALRYYLGLDGLFLGWKQRLFLPCGGGDAFHAQPSSRMLAPSHSLANRCVLAGAGTSSL